MRKILYGLLALGISLIANGFAQPALACSDIFINHPRAHIEARSMDFGSNMAMQDTFGFIGQKNTTDIILDADKVPARNLATWAIKYGYWGRHTFHTPKIDDGMNTQGLSLSGLYLETYTKYAAYDPADTRPVIGVYDLGNYLLSQAKDVDEAISLVKGVQIVQAAIEIKEGLFLKNVPIHFTMRDKTGKSAVVEFVGGKVQVYTNAGNVLTNAPAYPEQLEYAKKFEGVNVKADGALTGMPGGYTSPDRFARGSILTRSMPVPLSTQEALYQADFIISSLTVPYLNIPGAGSRSNTIWTVLKDLDHQIVYTKNSVYFQGGKKIAPLHVVNGGYTIIDLSIIDFKTVPIEYIDDTIQPTPKDRVKRIITANDLPEFGE